MNNAPLQLTAISIGLLMLRLVVGLAMAAHGSQKLLGWFGGHGLAGTGGFFEMLGFKPGRLFALAACGADAFIRKSHDVRPLVAAVIQHVKGER